MLDAASNMAIFEQLAVLTVFEFSTVSTNVVDEYSYKK